MLKPAKRQSTKPQKSAIGHRRFPSSADWEARWDADVTLAQLRANAASFAAPARLFINRRFNEEGLRVRRAALRFAVSKLALDASTAATLYSDARLISVWYLEPARRAYMQIDAAADRAALARVARAAAPFAAAAFTDMRAAQNLIDVTQHGENSPVDELDLLQLQYHLQVLLAAAADLRQRVSPGAGRAGSWRRDRAIRLLAKAVEEATGASVKVSRGTNARPEAHFKNAAGRFVATAMSLLGWRDEHILARAFEA